MGVDHTHGDHVTTDLEIVRDVVLLHLPRRFAAADSNAVDEQIVLVVRSNFDSSDRLDFQVDRLAEQAGFALRVSASQPGLPLAQIH